MRIKIRKRIKRRRVRFMIDQCAGLPVLFLILIVLLILFLMLVFILILTPLFLGGTLTAQPSITPSRHRRCRDYDRNRLAV